MNSNKLKEIKLWRKFKIAVKLTKKEKTGDPLDNQKRYYQRQLCSADLQNRHKNAIQLLSETFIKKKRIKIDSSELEFGRTH